MRLRILVLFLLAGLISQAQHKTYTQVSGAWDYQILKTDSATGMPHKYALGLSSADTTPQIFGWSTPSGDSLVFYINGRYHIVPSGVTAGTTVNNIGSGALRLWSPQAPGLKTLNFIGALKGDTTTVANEVTAFVDSTVYNWHSQAYNDARYASISLIDSAGIGISGIHISRTGSTLIFNWDSTFAGGGYHSNGYNDLRYFLNSSTIPTANGGTGLNSFTNTGIFYASSASAISQITDAAHAGMKLTSMSGGYQFEDTAASISYTFSTGLNNASGTITNMLATGFPGGQTVIGGAASGESLTLSSTPNATKGFIYFGTGSAFNEALNYQGLGTTTPTSKLEMQSNALGATFPFKGGIVLRNTTASTAGAPTQYSPMLRFHGTAWTTVSLVSDSVDMYEALSTTQGGAVAAGVWNWQTSINGATATSAMTLSSTGILTANALISGGAITAGTGVVVASGNNFQWNTGATPLLTNGGSYTVAVLNNLNACAFQVYNTNVGTGHEYVEMGFRQNASIFTIGSGQTLAGAIHSIRISASGAADITNFTSGNVGIGSGTDALNAKFQLTGSMAYNGMPTAVATSFTIPIHGTDSLLTAMTPYTFAGYLPLRRIYTVSTPATGGTVTAVNGQINIINPSGSLAAVTIAMPSSPNDKDQITFRFKQAVSAITYSGGTVVGPASATQYQDITLTYILSLTSWL